MGARRTGRTGRAADGRRTRAYAPLTSAGYVGNAVLLAVALAAACWFGLDGLPLPVVLVQVVVAVVLAGALGYAASGWAMAAAVLLFFAGPVAVRFVPVGAQLSIRAWFMGLVAGWIAGALVRRIADRGLPAAGGGR